MAIDKAKLEAAKEKLKKHPGGSNLRMIDSTEKAQEMQKKAAVVRSQNAKLRRILKALGPDLKELSEEAKKQNIPAVDLMRVMMLAKYESGDWEGAFQAAQAVAPFETPKLSSQQVDMTTKALSDLTDEEFEAELKALEDEDEKG